jgi:hypothetical protein
MDKLIKLQSFAAMQYFLDNYYKQTSLDDIGTICSGVMLLADNIPADPAFEQDWLDSAKVIIPNYQEDMIITSVQAFMVAKEFLELYCRIGYSQEVDELINRMKVNNGHIVDAEISKLWDKSIKLAVNNGPMYLELREIDV